MNYVKGISLFFGGVIVGVLGVFVWLRKDYEKKIMEIEERTLKNREKPETEEKRVDSTELNDGMNQDREMYNGLTEKLNYSQPVSDGGEAALVRTVSANDISNPPSALSHDYPREDGEFEGPVICSEGEMLHANDGFTKHTLIWYMRDDLLTDEDGNVLEDPFYILGDKWKEAVGIEEEYKGYIKNDKQGAYYEIYAEDDSYALTHMDD